MSLGLLLAFVFGLGVSGLRTVLLLPFSARVSFLSPRPSVDTVTFFFFFLTALFDMRCHTGY
jgi:hypothetical protein